MDRPTATWTTAPRCSREMLAAGITAVGEFHYLHARGNELGRSVIAAARKTGIRLTLLDTCYLQGGIDGRPLEGAQRSFSDGDAERWAARVDELEGGEGVRIAAAIHSVRAVDPAAMRVRGRLGAQPRRAPARPPRRAAGRGRAVHRGARAARRPPCSSAKASSAKT